ncbi:MAG: pH regulation protein F [Bacteroidetes bacterium]|nr:pH regulation protein F [Bacteroidota bacterium]MCW5897036.1 pH regulation protein F [Bacteroidota bacterium]
MQDVLIYITNLLAVIIIIPFYRVLKGPTVFDRVLGVGAIGTKTLVLICLVGFIYGRLEMFIDIALAYAVLNFISVLAIAKYFKNYRKGA